MQLTIISLVVGVVIMVQADDLQDQKWEKFKEDFGKNYSSSEDKTRRAFWERAVQRIQTHTEEYLLGQHQFNLELNKFGDWSDQEYSSYLLGANPGLRNDKYLVPMANCSLSGSSLPTGVDWRKKGVVTGVKDQGRCGSCWAFAATGALEAQHALSYGRLVSLSEQNLVDCSRDSGNSGCAGGWPGDAFRYIISNDGIDAEESYPYKAKDQTCAYNKANKGATCRNYHNIYHDEDAMKVATIFTGPLAVAIDANTYSFRYYKSGVYESNSCSKTKVNHAVLVVGYDVDKDGRDYWIVKNSWGDQWGEDGYVRIARGKKMCCMGCYASYPIVKSQCNWPDNVTTSSGTSRYVTCLGVQQFVQCYMVVLAVVAKWPFK